MMMRSSALCAGRACGRSSSIAACIWWALAEYWLKRMPPMFALTSLVLQHRHPFTAECTAVAYLTDVMPAVYLPRLCQRHHDGGGALPHVSCQHPEGDHSQILSLSLYTLVQRNPIHEGFWNVSDEESVSVCSERHNVN